MEQIIIKALCNPVRLKLIKCISTKEKTVSELIQNCGLSQSAVSQHLNKLKEAGLIKDAKSGREVYYSLGDKNLTKISNLILNLAKRKN
jgi:ArsR family transcriptional regulator